MRAHLKQISDTTLDYETVYLLTDPSYNVMMDTQQALQLALIRRCAEEKIQLAVQLEAVVKLKAAGLV